MPRRIGKVRKRNRYSIPQRYKKGGPTPHYGGAPGPGGGTGPPDPDPITCNGNCGSGQPSGCNPGTGPPEELCFCYCDEFCETYNDCCDDSCTYCGFNCGQDDPPGGMQCDDPTIPEGQSCMDLTSLGYNQEPVPFQCWLPFDPDSQPPCYCDTGCQYYNDCCVDACACCGVNCGNMRNGGGVKTRRPSNTTGRGNTLNPRLTSSTPPGKHQTREPRIHPCECDVWDGCIPSRENCESWEDPNCHPMCPHPNECLGGYCGQWKPRGKQWAWYWLFN